MTTKSALRSASSKAEQPRSAIAKQLRLTLKPVAKEFVQARGSMSMSYSATWPSVRAQRQVKHQLARPIAASAADVGNFEIDWLHEDYLK